MANHLARFISNLSAKTVPLREPFLWSVFLDLGYSTRDSTKRTKRARLFLEAKYNPKCLTILSADSSSFGLGAVLLQVQPNGSLRPVSFASRSLTPTETRYAQVEKDALALTWAAERFQDYLRGIKATFQADHKPLVTLLEKASPDSLQSRTQRFRMRLMRFDYCMQYFQATR